MNDSSLFLIQVLLSAILAAVLVVRIGTVLMGWTALFVFNVFSASLSAIVFSRLFALEEDWVTRDHDVVFQYSGWAALCMVLGLWLAWYPLKGQGWKWQSSSGALPVSLRWVNPTFIFSAIILGAISSLVYPLFRPIPTAGGIVAVFAGWLKVGLLVAIVRWKLIKDPGPLIVTLVLYFPVSLVYALNSGHTPISIDVAIPAVLIIAFFNGARFISLVKLAIAVLLLSNIMLAWMASRGVIRSGELDNYSLGERATRFGEVFRENLDPSELTPKSVMEMLRLRIDMSDILAKEAGYVPNVVPFSYGGTLREGAFALVPRFLWPGKPRVAGYADFVSKYTGILRSSEDQTAIGVPVQFELYANGGGVAVCIGLFIFTWLCARLERAVLTRPQPLRVLLPSFMVLLAFGGGIQQIMLVLTSALTGGIAAYAIAWMIERFAPGFHARLLGLPRTPSIPAETYRSLVESPSRGITSHR